MSGNIDRRSPKRDDTVNVCNTVGQRDLVSCSVASSEALNNIVCTVLHKCAEASLEALRLPLTP